MKTPAKRANEEDKVCKQCIPVRQAMNRIPGRSLFPNWVQRQEIGNPDHTRNSENKKLIPDSIKYIFIRCGNGLHAIALVVVVWCQGTLTKCREYYITDIHTTLTATYLCNNGRTWFSESEMWKHMSRVYFGLSLQDQQCPSRRFVGFQAA